MDDNRIFYNANNGNYDYLKNAEKDANDELAIVKKVFGEDYECSQYLYAQICYKALGLSYDHSYENIVNERIRRYYEIAKNKAIHYIKTNNQEDYDEAKKLLEKYEELKQYKLVPVENLWSCVDDKVYEVEIDSIGDRHYTEFDPITILKNS